MKWSKLKHLVEQRFAPSIAKRLAIHSTAYGNCTCGHAWMTLDQKIVANFCTRAYWTRRQMERQGLDALPAPNKMYAEQFAEYGELSRQDAYRACWAFVHELSIEESLRDGDALIQTLAVVDSRIGKRRLPQIDADTLHPLARKLLTERRIAEGIPEALPAPYPS